MGYIQIILTACIVFPILSFFITLPYMVYNYNKYGSILFVRTLLIYGFILYLLTSYFLVILPLPSLELVKNINVGYQLVPFHFVNEIVRYSCFSITSPSTYIECLKEPWVYQAIYNLLLTLPFGIFLRYYFKCGFLKTMFFTFLLSLFFELTQLTGLFFIYPNAYRLFDVDDLIVNTFGGIIGFLITSIVKKVLPKTDELDIKSYKKGSKVTMIRRLTTFLIDLTLVALLFIITIFIMVEIGIKYNINIVGAIALFFIYVIVPLINNFQTIGEGVTRIKLVDLNGNFKRYKVIIRNILFAYFTLPVFYYLKLLLNLFSRYIHGSFSFIPSIFYILIISVTFILIFIRNFVLHKPFWYEKITKTKLISLIDIPEYKNK